MQHATILGMYGIFFALISVSFIKNFFFNANSYSRAIRMYSLGIFVAYLIITIIGIVGLVIANPTDAPSSHIKVFNNLNLVVYIIISLLMTGSMVSFDDKKSSVRDEWKYRSEFFINFKQSHKPNRRVFEKVQESLFWILIVAASAVDISIIVYSHNLNSGAKWLSITFAIIIFIHLSINYLLLRQKRNALIKKNTRYNLLKTIIREQRDTLPNKTKEESAIKALDLYSELFTNSQYYNRAVATNNAIVLEIAKYGDLKSSKILKYLRHPDNFSKYLEQDEFDKIYPMYNKSINDK